MKYTKPDFYTTEFEVNQTIAACDREITGTTVTTTYPAQTVICNIGGQSETIFSQGTSGCQYSSSQIALGYYDGVYYFCWYADTGASSKTPTDEQKALMAAVTEVADPKNWHYCAVASETISTDILGFSY